MRHSQTHRGFSYHGVPNGYVRTLFSFGAQLFRVYPTEVLLWKALPRTREIYKQLCAGQDCYDFAALVCRRATPTSAAIRAALPRVAKRCMLGAISSFQFYCDAWP